MIKDLTTSSERNLNLNLSEVSQELLTLEGEGSLFYRTAFSPDGNVLGSMNWSGVLHLWRAPSWAEIEAAEKAEAKAQ